MTSTRPRVRSTTTTVSGGGGGGGTGIVVWGPDFGESSDDNTFNVDVGDPTFPQLDLNGTVATITSTPAFTQLDLVGTAVTVTSTLTLPQVDLNGTVATVSSTVPFLDYLTSQMLASKDSWAETTKVAGTCVVDVNHNATDLVVSNVAIDNNSQALCGFDLSGFPSGLAGSAIEAATLTLRVKTAPTVTAATHRAQAITTATETWSETTVKCSNWPTADGGNGQVDLSVGTGTAGTDVSWNLLSGTSFAGRIAARMGVGTFTVLLSDQTVGGKSAVYESKDEGTNNSLGPRLTLQFRTV